MWKCNPVLNDRSQIMHLLNGLKIWQKLALLIAALGIPIILLTHLLIAEQNLAIHFARQEILGVNYLQPVRTLLQHLTEHRDMNNAYLSGDVLFREKITAKQRQLAEDLQAMDIIDAQSGPLLNSAASWQAIKADWQNLSAHAAHLTAQDSFTRHTALIEKLLDLNVQVGIASNLVLDPDADSYYLMDMVVNRLPFLVEHLGQLRGIATDIVARQQLAADDLLRLSKRLVHHPRNILDNTGSPI
jgi:hypothetical protein